MFLYPNVTLKSESNQSWVDIKRKSKANGVKINETLRAFCTFLFIHINLKAITFLYLCSKAISSPNCCPVGLAFTSCFQIIKKHKILLVKVGFSCSFCNKNNWFYSIVSEVHCKSTEKKKKKQLLMDLSIGSNVSHHHNSNVPSYSLIIQDDWTFHETLLLFSV